MLIFQFFNSCYIKKAIWHLAICHNWCFSQLYHSKVSKWTLSVSQFFLVTVFLKEREKIFHTYSKTKIEEGRYEVCTKARFFILNKRLWEIKIPTVIFFCKKMSFKIFLIQKENPSQYTTRAHIHNHLKNIVLFCFVLVNIIVWLVFFTTIAQFISNSNLYAGLY